MVNFHMLAEEKARTNARLFKEFLTEYRCRNFVSVRVRVKVGLGLFHKKIIVSEEQVRQRICSLLCKHLYIPVLLRTSYHLIA